VRAALPVFVNVKVCDFDCPSTTFPKAKVPGVTLTPGCAPVPVSETVSGELVASLVTVTLPEAFPPVVGAKAIFRIAVAVAFKVKGVAIPFAVKPAPVTATPEM
jgi:hypothetical protein